MCRQVRSVLPETYCLMLSSHDDPDAMLAAVSAGASISSRISRSRQIGQRLTLSKKTVRNTASRLLHKLDLHHRTQAALLAAKLHDPARDD
ncbi:MAG TPA: LuxR C-terminal-related transcriptional regulator [Mycobacterium sp.]|nr:LuxR C-terminal-related transcriptional regulator [Mycobacterium sp.]